MTARLLLALVDVLELLPERFGSDDEEPFIRSLISAFIPLLVARTSPSTAAVFLMLVVWLVAYLER